MLTVLVISNVIVTGVEEEEAPEAEAASEEMPPLEGEDDDASRMEEVD